MGISAFYLLPYSFRTPLDKPKLFRYTVDNLYYRVIGNYVKRNIAPPDFAGNVNPVVTPLKRLEAIKHAITINDAIAYLCNYPDFRLCCSRGGGL